MTHTYATAGDYPATFTATDKDGGTGPGLTVEIAVSVQDRLTHAEPEPTTDDPDPTTGNPDDTEDDGGGSLASTGSTVGLGSLLAGLGLLGAGECCWSLRGGGVDVVRGEPRVVGRRGARPCEPYHSLRVGGGGREILIP